MTNIWISSNSNSNSNIITYTNQPTNVALIVEGSLMVNGQDFTNVVQRLDAIEQRLAILTPDPGKLEKFETLQRIYDQYRMVEALCSESDHT